MKPGSVLVDIAVDQGGCFEDTPPTTHADPTYTVHNSVFYCVANMPGAVPNTSTYALTNATLPYTVALANKGWQQACRDDRSLALGLNTHDGQVTYATGRGGTRDGLGVAGRPRSADPVTERAGESGPSELHARRPHLPRPPRGRARARGELGEVLPARPAALPGLPGRRWGAIDLDEITEQTVSGFLMALREGDREHQPLSATSAGRTVVAVRGFHKFAVRDGLAADDPSVRRTPTHPGQAAAQGDPARRRRAAARGRRQRRDGAGAARPGAAGDPLRHRGAHLRGGGPRHRRPRAGRPRREHRAAAREGVQGAHRAGGPVTPARRCRPTSYEVAPSCSTGARAARPPTGRCSSTPVAGGSPGRARGP